MRFIGRSTCRALSPGQMEKRIKRSAWLIISGCTIRDVAEVMGTSKSTVAKDMDRLIDIDKQMYEQVRKILHHRGELAPILGGTVTKLRYQAGKSDRVALDLDSEVASRLIALGICMKCGTKRQHKDVHDLANNLICPICGHVM